MAEYGTPLYNLTQMTRQLLANAHKAPTVECIRQAAELLAPLVNRVAASDLGSAEIEVVVEGLRYLVTPSEVDTYPDTYSRNRIYPEVAAELEQECAHEWKYTGSAYGGDDERWSGEGRCYCIYCGADGDA